MGEWKRKWKLIFRFEDLGLRDCKCFGFRDVKGSGLQDLGLRDVKGLGLRVQGSGMLRVKAVRFKVKGW